METFNNLSAPMQRVVEFAVQKAMDLTNDMIKDVYNEHDRRETVPPGPVDRLKCIADVTSPEYLYDNALTTLANDIDPDYGDLSKIPQSLCNAVAELVLEKVLTRCWVY